MEKTQVLMLVVVNVKDVEKCIKKMDKGLNKKIETISAHEIMDMIDDGSLSCEVTILNK